MCVNGRMHERSCACASPRATTGVNGWIGERKDYLKIWSTLEAPDSEVCCSVLLLHPSQVTCAVQPYACEANEQAAAYVAKSTYKLRKGWVISSIMLIKLLINIAKNINNYNKTGSLGRRCSRWCGRAASCWR